MQEVSHRVAVISGAMIVNTLVYSLVPQILPGDAETIAHAADFPWRFHDVQTLWTTGSWLSALITIAFLHKFTFYVTAVLYSSAADEWEKGPKDPLTGKRPQRFKHRTFTHSITFFLLIFVVCYVAYLYLKSITALPLWLSKEIWVIIGGVLVALMVHVIMDMFSHDGVQVLSPLSDIDVGVLPQQVRYITSSPSESLFLWLFIFSSGVLFATGIIGF